MKTLLIIGGVLFLLLAFALLAAAVVVFFIMRRRRANAVPPVAPTPASVAGPPAETARAREPHPAPIDPLATVVASTAGLFGAMHGISGALAGRVFPIDQKGFYIGRDQTVSQVVIDNPIVSKRHVWIGLRDGGVIAIDQQSTNGTFLNSPSNRITEARLTPGDTLFISDDVARLQYRS